MSNGYELSIKEYKILLKIKKELLLNKQMFYIKCKNLDKEAIYNMVLEKLYELKEPYLINNIQVSEVKYKFTSIYKVIINYKYTIKEEEIINCYIKNINFSYDNNYILLKKIYNYISKNFKCDKKQHNFVNFLTNKNGDFRCFSLLFHLICNKYCIENITLEGFINNNFKYIYNWNFVKLDDKWYNIDIYRGTLENCYNYFLKPDFSFGNYIRLNKYVTNDFYNKHESAQVKYKKYGNIKVIPIKQPYIKYIK